MQISLSYEQLDMLADILNAEISANTNWLTTAVLNSTPDNLPTIKHAKELAALVEANKAILAKVRSARAEKL